MVRCRAGSRGGRGFLVSWFLGFWFLGFLVLGFLVSKMLGFKIAWFLGFKVLKFQRFNDPISPTNHVF